MSDHPADASEAASKLSSDFWKLWVGQAISSLGGSFTVFALPLLIFKLTNSALSLAFTTAAGYLPYLLFGLIIGAWVDRVDRKQLMIVTDLARTLIIGSIPLLFFLHILVIWWIYVVAFVSSTLSIGFNAAEFAAIPKLVNRDELVTANGRIQASYSAATIVGPLLAGLLVAVLPLASILLFDSCSFLLSALSLALIKTRFDERSEEQDTQSSIWQDIVEGLRYVLSNPVLRAISLMLALVNLVITTTSTQLVLFAKHQLQATDTQVGLFYAAGSAGVVLFSLVAGPLRKRLSFSMMALGTLMLDGLLIGVFSLLRLYWLALLLWLLMSGLGVLFNLTVGSLRQTIVPDHMLGRVMTIATVLAWSAIPLGTVVGGIIVDQVKNVALVYGVIGVVMFLVSFSFSFSALGHAERYLPNEKPPSAQKEA